MSDAMESQDLGPKASMDEQLTVNSSTSRLKHKQRAKAKQGEKAATEPRKSESSDDNEDGGVSISDEHLQLSTASEDKKPVDTASGPAFEKDNGQPLKSILKKTVGTKAEARQAEARQAEARQIGEGGSPSGMVLDGEDEANGRDLPLSTAKEDKEPVGTASGPAFEKENAQPLKSILKKTVGTKAEARQTGSPSGKVLDGEAEDNGGGVKLFQGAAERLKASKDDARESVHEKQGGVPIPSLMLETDTGLVASRTNSVGEPVFDPSAPGDGDGSPSRVGNACKRCVLM